MVLNVQYDAIGLVLKIAIGSNKNLFIKDDKDLNQKTTIGTKCKLNKEQIDALNFLNLKNNKFDVSVLQGTTNRR